MEKKRTELEIDFLKEEYQNFSISELAYGLGKSNSRIYQILGKLGLKKEYPTKSILCIIKNCIYPELEQRIEKEHGHGLGKCWICISHYLDNKGYPIIVRKGKLQLLSHIIYRASV